MANSSDWLGALLERPQDQEVVAKPEGWLAELARPNVQDKAGFVGGLPFGRPEQTTNPADLPSDGTDTGAETRADTGADTGDALVDILREALGEDKIESDASHPIEPPPAPQPAPQAASQSGAPVPAPPAEPLPDPIAEAFARGRQEGWQQGKQEALDQQDSDAQHKLQLRQTFRALDQAAMDALASELGDTVIALCAQTLADYAPDAAALQARCTHAAQRLGTRASGAVLTLHPDDLALIDETSLAAWTVVGDPAAERGGLRFETEDGSISDRPSDWRRAIAAAIRG